MEVYAELANCGEHLFGRLLGGALPKQWAHYPEDDAIDADSGFHWFYHSHAPEDRPGSAEHGHIHLFARRKLWGRRLRSAREIEFKKLAGSLSDNPNTRHLLTIGFDAKGIPVSLFMVNSWVTGDLMLSDKTSVDVLDQIKLATGHEAVYAIIESIVRLYLPEIHELLARRDASLVGWGKPNVLGDEALEVLSKMAIDVDGKLASMA